MNKILSLSPIPLVFRSSGVSLLIHVTVYWPASSPNASPWPQYRSLSICVIDCRTRQHPVLALTPACWRVVLRLWTNAAALDT